MKAPSVSAEIKGDVQSTHERRSPLRNGNRQGNYNNAPRCGAKTRAGTPCKRAAMRNKDGIHTRCPLHGGKCTGARTAEGRERIGKANLKHGRYTKAEKERRAFFLAMRECYESFDNYDERLRAYATLRVCGEEIDRCLKSGADYELAKYCQGALAIMRIMRAPMEKLDLFLDLKLPRPDKQERLFRRALEAGAAGLGCWEYAKTLADD